MMSGQASMVNGPTLFGVADTQPGWIILIAPTRPFAKEFRNISLGMAMKHRPSPDPAYSESKLMPSTPSHSKKEMVLFRLTYLYYSYMTSLYCLFPLLLLMHSSIYTTEIYVGTHSTSVPSVTDWPQCGCLVSSANARTSCSQLAPTT